MVFQGHRVKVCEVSKEIALKHDIRSLSQKDSFGQLNMTVLLQTDTPETLDYEVHICIVECSKPLSNILIAAEGLFV